MKSINRFDFSVASIVKENYEKKQKNLVMVFIWWVVGMFVVGIIFGKYVIT